MSNEFQLPARPWGDKEIKFLMAHEALLDNETRAELGLKASADAPESTQVPSDASVEAAQKEANEKAAAEKLAADEKLAAEKKEADEKLAADKKAADEAAAAEKKDVDKEGEQGA